MSDQTDPSAGQVVQLLDKYLFGWAYEDIERASIQGCETCRVHPWGMLHRRDG